MFGRILSVEVFDINGKSRFIVDPTQETKLMCSGTIEYLPTSSGAPKATIQIYNLPATLATPIFSLKKQVTNQTTMEKEYVDDPKFIRISFGYRDENDGQISDIFIGSIVRAFTTRKDALTTVTKVYAYQLQSLFATSVSSCLFEAGTSVYDVVDGLFKSATVQGVEYEIPEIFKGLKIDAPQSFYGKTLDCVDKVVQKVDYMVSTTPLGVSFVAVRPTQADLDVTILAEYDDEGKVVARSGLIGFPCIDTEGMRFETLINPKILLYSYVWLPNNIISDDRYGSDAFPQYNFGATYDPAGLYRIVKMETQFDSHMGDCKTSYVAVAAGTSSAYYR